MTSLDTTAAAPIPAAAGFASSDNDAGSNKPTDPFKTVLSTAYRLGKDAGKGDVARFEVFDLARVSACEGVLKYVQIKRGKQAGGGKDMTPVAQFAERHVAGVVAAGGADSKATQKNRFNTIVKWCDGPGSDTTQPDNTWQRAKAEHEKVTARNASTDVKKDRTKIWGLAEVMLRCAQLQTNAKGEHGSYKREAAQGQPLTDRDIEYCVYRNAAGEIEFAAKLKAFQAVLVAKIEEEGGENADDSYHNAGKALNALMTHISEEYNMNEEEKAADAAIDLLIKRGKLVPTTNGTGFKFAF